MQKYQKYKDLRSYVGLSFLKNVDPNVDQDEYIPVTKDQWRMLKELEPGKFSGNYESYIYSKTKQYLDEVERRRTCSLSLQCVSLDLTDNGLDKSKQEVSKIMSDPLFNRFVGKYQSIIDLLKSIK